MAVPASVPISSNEPSSSSTARRSRTVSLPASCWRPTLPGPPIRSASSRRRPTSSSSGCHVITKEANQRGFRCLAPGEALTRRPLAKVLRGTVASFAVPSRWRTPEQVTCDMTDLISVQLTGHVAVVEMHRPPNNFFDEALLASLAETLAALDEDGAVRCVVLCSEG